MFINLFHHIFLEIATQHDSQVVYTVHSLGQDIFPCVNDVNNPLLCRASCTYERMYSGIHYHET